MRDEIFQLTEILKDRDLSIQALESFCMLCPGQNHQGNVHVVTL